MEDLFGPLLENLVICSHHKFDSCVTDFVFFVIIKITLIQALNYLKTPLIDRFCTVLLTFYSHLIYV